MKTLRRAALVVALGTLAVAGSGSIASGSTNAIVNGDFETGSLSGWGHAPGHPLNAFHGWFANHGAPGPISGLSVPPPPQGHTQALVDQGGPGGNVLFQTFTVPASGKLSLTLWYANYNGVFYTPNMLVPGDDFQPDQQLRIDLTLPNAGLYSLKPHDVVANVFRTVKSSPAVRFPHTLTYNLAPWAGRTLRLRIAEVDDQFFFNVGVDSVRVTGTGGAHAVTLRSAHASADATKSGRSAKLYAGKPKSAF